MLSLTCVWSHWDDSPGTMAKRPVPISHDENVRKLVVVDIWFDFFRMPTAAIRAWVDTREAWTREWYYPLRHDRCTQPRDSADEKGFNGITKEQSGRHWPDRSQLSPPGTDIKGRVNPKIGLNRSKTIWELDTEICGKVVVARGVGVFLRESWTSFIVTWSSYTWQYVAC